MTRDEAIERLPGVIADLQAIAAALRPAEVLPTWAAAAQAQKQAPAVQRSTRCATCGGVIVDDNGRAVCLVHGEVK